MKKTRKTPKKPATKKTDAASPAIDAAFAPVVAAFAKDPKVSCGKMMASVGLKVNSKIFAMSVRGDFVAKLPKQRVDELVAAGTGKYFDPRHDGRLMKEWVTIAGRKATWVDLAKEAHAFVKAGKRGS
jgi:TfoX/Sxy family transcriptional regulator of competence genes